MLKIKDNIPLTELEKFGFSRYEELSGIEYYYINCGDNRSHIFVYLDDYTYDTNENVEKRQIALCSGYFGDYAETWFGEKQLDVLYDLIKADMVEKVEN